MTIEIKDVKKLAELSRIHLEEGEVEELRASLDSILGYVEQIKQVSADSNIEQTFPVTNILREDIDPNPTGANREKLLNSAPKREGNYVKVKKILGLISE
ncbi:MAG: Asp-tRNA(Asn)/Glu-tRNA(Gln) amidotransferase subunit GatC [bacterium]